MAEECGKERDGRWAVGGDENKAMDIVGNNLLILTVELEGSFAEERERVGSLGHCTDL